MLSQSLCLRVYVSLRPSIENLLQATFLNFTGIFPLFSTFLHFCLRNNEDNERAQLPAISFNYTKLSVVNDLFTCSLLYTRAIVQWYFGRFGESFFGVMISSSVGSCCDIRSVKPYIFYIRTYITYSIYCMFTSYMLYYKWMVLCRFWEISDTIFFQISQRFCILILFS